MEEWIKIETDVWNPKEGEEISGKYLGVQHDVGENKSEFYRLDLGNGKVLGVWGSKVLDGKMSAVNVGSQVKILFKGLVKPVGGGREYKDYEVFTKKLEEIN